MTPDWPAKIRRAQAVPVYTRGGVTLPRIPFGQENPEWGEIPCRDCGVVRGELHVPACEYETCPFCGQSFGEGCPCDLIELREPSQPTSRLQRGLDAFERIAIRLVLIALALSALWFLVWLWRQGVLHF